ncbi:hypothetical protein Bhyg_12462 [Pseudolycoriella hygida]|uniref:THAP-type domain-containing protein n=1 Tax=Pseudolycoriella hygida TaxID=35572 RepID=A0A9Q0MXM0_9DIPT|nr:hypothetical protein Bhyg_12462 [Pseudolycoriella hygida]
MVRRCIVAGCVETDLTTLVHRFPRKHCKQWQNSLQLHSFPIEDLLDKYVVCSHHFRIKDYRHRESKHLNSTAIPTLQVIPDEDKILELHTSNVKANKRRIVVATTAKLGSENVIPYSKRVSLEVHEAKDLDDSLGNNSRENYDFVEEELFINEEIMLEEGTSSKVISNDEIKDLLTTDDNCEGGMYCNSETDLKCDNKPVADDRLPNYVELIEANDEIDDECLRQSSQQLGQTEIPMEWHEMYKNVSRNELIEQLVAASSRIKELETKLENIQKAHLSVIQNLDNFNKVLIS